MRHRGENPEDLPERDVFYLVRGRNASNVKVCLVHGSFFETVRVEELIRESFRQVIEEGLGKNGEQLGGDLHL